MIKPWVAKNPLKIRRNQYILYISTGANVNDNSSELDKLLLSADLHQNVLLVRHYQLREEGSRMSYGDTPRNL